MGKYASTSWYHLQVIINAGNRETLTLWPVDWNYQPAHINGLHTKGGGPKHPYRYAVSHAKMIQQFDDKKELLESGIGFRQMHPAHYTPIEGVKGTIFEDLPRGDRAALLAGMLNATMDLLDRYPTSDWLRDTLITKNPESAIVLRPESYRPKVIADEKFSKEMHYGAYEDIWYTMIPHFRKAGVDEPTLNRLIDFGQTMWPKGKWNEMKVAAKPLALGDGWYLLKNRYEKGYLYQAGDTARYGTLKAETDLAFQWRLESPKNKTYYRLKNRASGEYLHIEKRKAYAEVTALGSEDWHSARWKIVPQKNNFVRLECIWGNKKNPSTLHTQNRLGHVQHGAIHTGAHSSHWKLIEVEDSTHSPTPRQIIQAEDYISRDAQQDIQGMPWQRGNEQSGGQTYMSTADLGQCVVNGWTAGAKLDYNFVVPADTTYHIWVRRYASDGGDNSAYFGLDGKGIDNIDNRGAYGQWYWLKLGSYPLKAGEHNLSLVRREDGYRVDQFLVSSEAGHPNQSNNARQSDWVSEKVATVSDSATASLVEVYPNPVRDGQLQINTDKTTGPIDRVELLGIQGQVLLRRTASERTGIRLDVRALPPGVYVVKAYGQRQTWTEKVLIE